MTERDSKKQTAIIFLVLCPIFLIYSLLLSQWGEGRAMDFGVYWQAGHMILAGQNVYDHGQWEAVRQAGRIVDYPAGIFPYPLPLAILFSLLAWLPLQTAYTVWMFLAQVAILVSIVVLLSFYPSRSGYLDLLAIGGIFFFRPMFSLINSGQILSFLMLPLVLGIRWFHDGKWFAGGLVLSILSLKPSLGFPILLLTGIWLSCSKRGRGIWGMILGGFLLVLIGALVNYRWVIDFLNTSDNSFYRFFGMQPTMWGVVNKIFQSDTITLVASSICIVVILMIEVYLFWRDRSKLDAFATFASIVPTASLVTPYMWNYDQVVLAVPIIFVLIHISIKYGTGKAALFTFGVVGLSFAMVVIAYTVGHDVWSFWNSFVVWIFALYFVTKNNWFPKHEGVIANAG